VLGNLTLETDENVVVGFEGADDAAVLRFDGEKYMLQTVDFFTPVVDDPYQFGQIAAANSLSDIYAMGGQPLFALNIVGFPIKELPKSMLTDILQGGADKAKEAGIPIVGGHSVDDKEPKYGLVVTGEVTKSQLVRNDNAQEGDVLILTKPIGTGIIATAIKKAKAPQDIIDEAVKSMSTLNNTAVELFKDINVNAVTDVTGFGFAGHLLEMCKGSGMSAEIYFSDIPLLNGTKQLAEDGFIPGGTKRNFHSCEKFMSFTHSISDIDKLILADAQTSGGLLISLPEKDAKILLMMFNDNGQTAEIIGQITTKKEPIITVL